MSDDLFTPTITSAVPAKPPWRVDSLVYPAFFGGPLAAAVLGLLNARRLRVGPLAFLAVAATGIGAIAVRIAFLVSIGGLLLGAYTLVGVVPGLAVWAAIRSTQNRPYRSFALRGGEPAKLFWPAVAAVLGCGLAEAVVTLSIVNGVSP